MTDALVAFLKARLDDDERTAQAATPGPWCDSGGYVTDIDEDGHSRVQVTDFGTQDEDSEGSGPQGQADSAHIARHDPARTLREVEAARAVIGLYEEAGNRMDRAMNDSDTVAYQEARVEQRTLRKVLLHEAAVHEAHPDYLPEWQP
ncbi:DUF6221 family protein [Streptomyces sp. f150]|uniref:DUF6221 family protein n=1 Tax=Streptomyces sp. f150 TaxID=1827699 RepID=UPI000BEF69FA|nr:DUF6221 family protein [Streptomyces sp. f150]